MAQVMDRKRLATTPRLVSRISAHETLSNGDREEISIRTENRGFQSGERIAWQRVPLRDTMNLD